MYFDGVHRACSFGFILARIMFFIKYLNNFSSFHTVNCIYYAYKYSFYSHNTYIHSLNHSHTIFQHIYLLFFVRYHNSSLYWLQFCVQPPTPSPSTSSMNKAHSFTPQISSILYLYNEKEKEMSIKNSVVKKNLIHSLMTYIKFPSMNDDASNDSRVVAQIHIVHVVGHSTKSMWNVEKSVRINE